jgi:hypothetical protein
VFSSLNEVQAGVDYSNLRYRGAKVADLAKASGNEELVHVLTKNGSILQRNHALSPAALSVTRGLDSALPGPSGLRLGIFAIPQARQFCAGETPWYYRPPVAEELTE